MRAACVAVGLLLTAGVLRAEESALPGKALEILKTHCHRCHGDAGSLEGGFNYVLDLPKLIARKKIIPSRADDSPLFRRVVGGKMPPPGEGSRPSEAEVATLRKWIEAGASAASASAPRPFVSDAEVFRLVLADLDRVEKRSRRFTRYFSLVPLANAGLGDDELQSYRNALAKLLNSLSWHPRITLPAAIDPNKLVLRLDLRDVQWDANLWNRILAEYPYGVFHDTAAARACAVATATRLPLVRADWFVATASRGSLYHDLLQLPTTSTELERQLRVDVTANILQERVARLGFNGSGISRNNRLLERHDAVHGSYWRTYDFDAVPQNLVERTNLIPDRRNLFAYPLGPGPSENQFQHAGGEVIFNLPNGLQGYMLVNAANARIDKGPTAIVSDPKRPDRAVETGVSCMGCHYRGILPKDDQIRDFVGKNPKTFARADAELIRALYAPRDKMKALMDEDAERFRKALEKTGNKVTAAEPTIAMTLHYEADVDAATLAAEAGLPVAEFQARLAKSELLRPNFGALRVAGGTVSRQVVVQSFGDVVKELRLGSLLQPGQVATTLPDNTGEIDPLEAQSSTANDAAFSSSGRLAVFASGDRSVRFWDVEAGRELRRGVGHSASVWAAALSPDARLALTGGADATLRAWDVETGRELYKLEGHEGLVSCVALSPDGRQALSGGHDHAIILWDLDNRRELRRFAGLTKYVNAVAFAPDGKRAAVSGDRIIHLVDLESGKEVRAFEGHADTVTCVAVSPDGRYLLSGADDRTARLWDVESGRVMRSLQGHTSYVKSVGFSSDGTRAVTGGSDQSVRLWDVATGKELGVFPRHGDTVVRVGFTPDGRATVSASRDGDVRVWVPSLKDEGGRMKDEPTPALVHPSSFHLHPSNVIPVGGTVTSLHLSPNGRWLYYLTDGKLGRIDTVSLKKDRERAPAEGTETLAMSSDGKTLVATAAGKRSGLVQVLDPATMEARKEITLSTVPYDVAVRDDGLAFVSGGAGEWTDVTVVDVGRGSVLARWGGVWRQSLLALTPRGDRLYVSTQGVKPGTVESLPVPADVTRKPSPLRSPAERDHPLGSEIRVTPDGRFLLCKTGTVLRASASKEEELQHVATVKPFVAAVVDAERGAALLLGGDGTLWQYGYPEWKLQATHRLPAVVYQAVLDGKAGRLYVAGFDPRTLAERPRVRGVGDVQVYDVAALLGKTLVGPR